MWRGAFRVLEKIASAALDDKVGEVIKAGLIDRYGLPDAVLERNEQMRLVMQACPIVEADRYCPGDSIFGQRQHLGLCERAFNLYI